MKQKQTLLGVLTCLIISFGLVFNTLVLPFMFLAFNESFYTRSFLDLKVHEDIGFSEESLTRVTHALITYIKDGSGDIKGKEVVRGEEVVFYNEKEQIHLEDIRKLIQSTRIVILIVNILLIGSCILALRQTLKKQEKGLIKKHLSTVLSVSSAMMFLVLAGLFALYQSDFDWAFRKFHEIFFSNDLWLLDPRTDRLIQLMPLEFFIHFTTVWLSVIGSALALYLVSAIILRKTSK